ncbi:hypothetical protein [Cesiribacter sp. SM1]|uniref:hypothetical protein n=1 Tax=Cesiribacter sp. SM1 TaxID=2861196 RepID=UPI001CD2649B|nr:hypothetical protein [Cesiribacter sp. SM1]
MHTAPDEQILDGLPAAEGSQLPRLHNPIDSLGPAKAATHVLTLGKAIKLYTGWRQKQRQEAKTPCKYLRIARAYLEWCLEQDCSIDPMSVNLYTADKKGNVVFGVRNFLAFAQLLQLERVVPSQREDHQQSSRHALILYYIGQKKTCAVSSPTRPT